MQPPTTHRPVMDIAAPPKPQGAPVSPKPTEPAPNLAADVRDQVAVAPAPPQATDEDNPLPKLELPAQPKPAKAAKKAPAQGSHKPVALITATILVMLVLMVLAVIVYTTSQSS